MTHTDKSKDLDKQIDEMLTWDIDGHKEPVIFQPEMKKAIKKLVHIHTSNILDKLIEQAEDVEYPHKRYGDYEGKAVPLDIILAVKKGLK